MNIANTKKSVFLAIFSAFVFVAAVVLMTAGDFLAENSGKISQDLQNAITANPPESQLSVIVQYYERPRNQDIIDLQNLGARIVKELNIINAYAIEIAAHKISELAQVQHVKNLSPDRDVHACVNIAAPTVGAYNSINYYNMTGYGVTVAILDSGVVPGDKLTSQSGRSRIIANVDFVQDGAADGFDSFGHGTYIAGIIGMKIQRDSSRNIISTGIAPDCMIASIRVLDSLGKGKASSVIEGIQWCMDHATLYNIRILNLSISHPVFESFATDPLTLACEKAWNAGIVVVASSGNHGQDRNGYGTIGSPGNDPYIITAGATNDINSPAREDDLLAAFSSKGPSLIDYILKPDIVAPGTSVFSIRVPGSYLDDRFASNRVSLDGVTYPYFRLNGSSVSAAFVSGAAALMIQKAPSLTPATIKARLMKSADKSLNADLYTRGAGYLNIISALLDFSAATSGKSPRVFQTDSGITLETINWDSSGLLKDRPIWGNELDWGEDNISGDLSVWGSTAIYDYQRAWSSNSSEENMMTQ